MGWWYFNRKVCVDHLSPMRCNVFTIVTSSLRGYLRPDMLLIDSLTVTNNKIFFGPATPVACISIYFCIMMWVVCFFCCCFFKFQIVLHFHIFFGFCSEFVTLTLCVVQWIVFHLWSLHPKQTLEVYVKPLVEWMKCWTPFCSYRHPVNVLIDQRVCLTSLRLTSLCS